MKLNGVPLRRVNARYVIATKAKVGLKDLDHKLMEKVSSNDYWKRDKSSKSKKDEEAFFKQGEKQEVGHQNVALEDWVVLTADCRKRSHLRPGCQIRSLSTSPSSRASRRTTCFHHIWVAHLP